MAEKLGVTATAQEKALFSSVGKSRILSSNLTRKGPSADAALRLQRIFQKTSGIKKGSSEKDSNSTATATVTRQDSPIGTATVTCNSLNVRSGAGTNYERIGGLTNGKTVEVYEEKDGWLRIKFNGSDGWISKQYTEYVKTPTTEPEPSTSYQVRVTSDIGLNVRDKPGNGSTPAADSTKLGLLSEGTIVTVLDEQNGWYKIDYNGKVGWICAQYTEKYEPPTVVEGDGGGIIPEGCSGVGIDVPIDPQNTNYNCGAASGAMSLAGRGLNISEQQVAKAAETNANDGTYVYKLVNALNGFVGSKAYKYEVMNNYSSKDFFNSLKTSISAKCMPIGRIATTNYKSTWGYSSGGHYVCVAGAYEKSDGTRRVIVNDPFSGSWSSSNPKGQKVEMDSDILFNCGKAKGDAYFIHNT